MSPIGPAVATAIPATAPPINNDDGDVIAFASRSGPIRAMAAAVASSEVTPRDATGLRPDQKLDTTFVKTFSIVLGSLASYAVAVVASAIRFSVARSAPVP